MAGRTSNSTVRVLITFLSHCSQLARKSGLRFLCIYLKTQYVNLQQSIAGHPLHDLTPLGARVSRRGGGIPACIPILHRIWIRKGSHFHVRFWLSLFSIYRVIEFPGKVKLATITDPFGGADLGQLLPRYSSYVCGPFRKSLEKHFSTDFLWDAIHDRKEALRSLPVKPFMAAKSTPVVSGHISTSFVGVLMTLHAWRFSPLLPFLKDWMKVTGNTRFLNWFEEGLKFAEGRLGTTYPSPALGKLGLKDEPAGKVRVFAMVDCITQWVFRPLHDRIFEILRLIPQDGTFDQERPLKHLSALGMKGRKLNSFDLSAATDRLPVKIQATLLSSLIGAHLANIWMILLVSREYALPERAVDSSGMDKVYYTVGQPMGALTSWAMLALTHHTIVQWAAFRAGVIKPGEWFSDYAILGDDIVLADERVSDMYLLILEELGVQVGLAKSLVSTSGALEFAKRFIVGPVNLSPIPIVEIVAGMRNLSAAIELSRKYRLSKETLAGVLGFGYKVIGSMNGALRCLGSRARTLVLAHMAPKTPDDSLLEFLSYTGEKPREIESPAVQSYRDAFASRMMKRLDDLEPQLKSIKTLVTVDRTRAHYGTVEFPPESVDIFLRQFVSINKPPRGKKGPRTYQSNYFFRDELGPVCSSVDEAIAGMRQHVNPSERRFIHSLFEYVYREPYLDVLSDIGKLRTTLEDTKDFSIEELENTLLSLDSIESDLSSVALFPRTSERLSDSPSFTMAPNRFVKMWKSL
nr:MAG: putative RNA-dependent RNA polymerase [Mitoviridae sp.]